MSLTKIIPMTGCPILCTEWCGGEGAGDKDKK